MGVWILFGIVLLIALLCAVIVLQVQLLRRPAPMQQADLPPALAPEALESAELRLMEHFTQRFTSFELKEDVIARAQRDELQRALKTRFEEGARQMETHLKAVRDTLQSIGSINEGVQRLGDSVHRFNTLLANVKARGTWGEVQLERILSDMFVPGQYERNVKPIPRSQKIVEFALALPGTEEGKKVWLPIDSKFPVEDYERMLAADSAEAAEAARKALIANIKKFATSVAEYVAPPHTTDFAILFVPTEGLFLEAARDEALQEDLRRKHILLTGPQTIAALLNALQMGFRTLAVQKQSAKAWDLLIKTKKRLDDYLSDCESVARKLEESGAKLTAARSRIELLAKDLRTVTVPEEENTHA